MIGLALNKFVPMRGKQGRGKLRKITNKREVPITLPGIPIPILGLFNAQQVVFKHL